MILRILKIIVLTVVCAILLSIIGALCYRAYLQYRVSESRAIRPANGIDSLERVRIGGIDQWIEVRGDDVNNPILLFIHGGPGIAFIPLAGSFQGPWERHFTVVQWDQRGAGKTYASNGRKLQRRTMNVAQMEQDTLDVVNYLRQRFHRQKIFVVGHSWGSVLGLWLAHEHPELLYAYVGTGQLIDTTENDALAYRDALRLARSTQNAQAVTELESIAPYPTTQADERKESVARRWEGKLLGPGPSVPQFTDTKRIMRDVFTAPEYSLGDDIGFMRGMALSLEMFLPQLTDIHLAQMGSEYRVPVFFFEGRDDPFCRPAAVLDFSRKITGAPAEFVWIEDAGHFPFFEQKQEFTEELVNRVLPLAR